MTSHKPTDRTTGPHRTDFLSLIFGLLFLAVAGWWAAAYYLKWELSVRFPDAGWILAGALILLGLIGIAASLRRDRRNGDAIDGSPGEPGTPVDPLAADRTADLLTAGDPGGHRPE